MQNLTALVGKAFQLAFADSKFPQGTELKMEPLMHTSSDERLVQGRRWVGILNLLFCYKFIVNLTETLIFFLFSIKKNFDHFYSQKPFIIFDLITFETSR